MRIINTAIAELPNLDTLGQLALYNGLDCMTLFEINAGLDELMTPTKRTTYEFEMELTSALLGMELTGFNVDTTERDRLIQEHEVELAIVQSHLHTFCKAIGYYDYYREIAVREFAEAISASPDGLPRTWAEWLTLPISTRRAYKVCNPVACAEYHKALKLYDLPFNGNSTTQKLRLFYHFFGSPANLECEKYPVLPPWNKAHGISEHKTRNTNNEYTPAADREALEKINLRALDMDPRDAHVWAWPFIKGCLEIADITKTLGFLRCRLERGIFRSSFNAATETGRLSSSANAQGYGCFPPGAEALTPFGWKLLEKIEEGETVLQWWPDGQMEWVAASPYQATFIGNLCSFQGEQLKYDVTPEHRFACQQHIGQKSFYEATALQLYLRNSQTRLKLSGILQGSLVVSRLLVALLADGSLEHPETGYWRIGFKKQRKIDRFLALLKEQQIPFHEVSASDGYRRFSLNVPLSWPQDWGSWILDLTQESAENILDELRFWDGTTRGQSIIFYTSRLYRAEWVQILAHTTGFSASIIHKEQSAGSWSNTLMYHVNIKPRDFAAIESRNKVRKEYEGPVYCLTVPSSFFLVRQHGTAFVTGNSNAQNISPRLRRILTVRPPFKLAAIDYGQIESRCVAARCFVQFGATAYLNAVNSGDLHSLAASMVWEDLPWPEDFNLKWLERHGPFPYDMLKAAKKIASEPFYRGKSRRDVSKTLGHGSSYLGKPPQMSRMSHIDVKLIEHYQAVFFAAFPEMKAWHRWIAEQVQRFGEVTTIMGRTRRFFNRPNDDSTLREAVAFDPQSTAADYTNTALLALHKLVLAGKLDIQLRGQKHDELLFSFHQEQENFIIPQVVSVMEHPITITSPTGEARIWTVPTEAEVGWNLGRRSPTNPDGLVGFPDTRTRVNNPFDFFGATL